MIFKNPKLLTTLSLSALLGTSSLFSNTAAKSENWHLVWADEFETDGLPNAKKWAYDVGASGWGNKELQYYTQNRPQNARVENGSLIIEARKEQYENAEYTSARLVTKGLEAWTYGRFEIRAKLPDGLGTWPAIWMLPVDWNVGSGSWPDVGEIDIMEHVGYDVGVVHASAHSKKYQWQIGTQKTGTIELKDATERFHTYVIEWNESKLTAYVDDTLFFEYVKDEGASWESWPYARDYYLILNVAVGGAWGGAKGIDPDCFPQRMEIDYVRVYQRH